MPLVRYKIKDPCFSLPTSASPVPRIHSATSTSLHQAATARRRYIHASIFRMDSNPVSGSNFGLDGGLKLKNRLNESRSPYVRGHMHNPVAWQQWGPEALDLARKSNRLIFISIGYAACHWCHVMERESFENNEVAEILNDNFVPIKIDREERPDVDRIYMNYVQATTGGGGWPLNVFITPDLQPIFGGTYWPGPGSTMTMEGHAGFMGILEKIRNIWITQRERCIESAKEITAQLRDFAEDGNISRKDGAAHEGLELDLLDDAYEHFKRRYDDTFAGFGSAPKFPTPSNLHFLLKLGQYPRAVTEVVGLEDVARAKDMALNTLKRMNKGGIHDLIGNGFARYSVTRDWSLPHFEKMLYDQVQLLSVYLDAYILTRESDHLSAVRDIATYLTTAPMHAKDGGFYSSEDADSLYRSTDKENREGAFYVWTLKEFQDVLGDRDAEILARYYNVRDEGNVAPEHDAHDELINQNVLAINGNTPVGLAKQFGLSDSEIFTILESGKQKLLDHRNRERPRPALDDKIVVSWNGLAIGALARTAAILSYVDTAASEEYLAAAIKAASFIQKELYDSTSKTLVRVYREGPGDIHGFADDYAYLISGLIDLYEATFDTQHLKWAEELQQTQLRLFWDKENLGFFSTPENQNDLIMRLKDGMDNAEPGTNGVSACNLDRLGAMLEDANYTQKARETISAFEAEIMQHPFLFPSMMDAIVTGKLGMRHAVITGDGEKVEEWLRKYRSRPQGLGTISRIGPKTGDWLKERNSMVREMDAAKEGIMICENGACRDGLTMDLGDVAAAVPII